MEFCIDSISFLFLAGGFLKSVGKAISSIASPVSSALGFATNLLGAAAPVASAYGQYKANQDNLAEAQRNRDWQEMMSSTTHQRQVADLRAAGLNPILSAHGGAPMGKGAQAEVGNIAGGLTEDVFNAKRFMEIEKDIKEAEVKLKGAMTSREDSTTALNKQTTTHVAEQERLARLNQNVAAAQELYTLENTNTARLAGESYAAAAARDYSQARVNSAQEENIRLQSKGGWDRLRGRGFEFLEGIRDKALENYRNNRNFFKKYRKEGFRNFRNYSDHSGAD